MQQRHADYSIAAKKDYLEAAFVCITEAKKDYIFQECEKNIAWSGY